MPYDPAWPARFAAERDHLLACLPSDLVRQIEHLGSTAAPGLAAKPIVDMLVEVADLGETKTRIAPILEARRPTLRFALLQPARLVRPASRTQLRIAVAALVQRRIERSLQRTDPLAA